MQDSPRAENACDGDISHTFGRTPIETVKSYAVATTHTVSSVTRPNIEGSRCEIYHSQL